LKPINSKELPANVLIRFIVSVFLSIILVSCSAKLPYASNYPLTGEIFQSRDGMLKGKVPSGWFKSTDDSLAPALSVWLLKEDLSATVIVRELNVDSLTAMRIRSEGLKLLAILSAGYQGLNIEKDIFNLKDYSDGGKKYCSYEIGLENNRRRVVVFKAFNRFYECEARVLKGEWKTDDMRRLFSVQQTVLSSLTY
jgi:hypothetical protein